LNKKLLRGIKLLNTSKNQNLNEKRSRHNICFAIIYIGRSIGGKMTVIKAAIKKEKASKKVIYSFEVNNDVFEAHYYTGKKQSLEIKHNGAMLGIIDRPKAKFEYVVNSETNPINITAWIDNGISISSFISKNSGVGIEVDGKPVQYTLTDPETHINNGRSGLYILLFILAFKSIWTYYNTFKGYASHIVAGITSTIYFVPFILALIAGIKYKSWTTFAILTGIILSILELIDYAFGIPSSIIAGANGVTLLIWILIRISALYLLYNAFKWKRKQKE
jgi:hypothetical protein